MTTFGIIYLSLAVLFGVFVITSFYKMDKADNYSVANDFIMETSKINDPFANIVVANNFYTLFGNSKNAVIITDANTKIEYVNDGFINMFGYGFKDVEGKNVSKLLSPKDSENTVNSEVFNSLINEDSVAEEILKFHKDGSEVWVHVTMIPIKNENGETKYIFIEDNISEEKFADAKQYEYLKNLEKEINEVDKFAYIVSHDLKAPLRAIGNLTEWIEEDIGAILPPASVKNFDIIKGRVRRMEALINGVLDYTKAGKNKGQFVSFDTRTLLKETFDLIGPPYNSKIEISNNLPVLHSDKIKLQQVFMNLISNSIKYNDKPEIKIQVGVEEEKNFWHFKVIDNGPGIEKQFQDKIFVIFQTLNARDEVESTGVGLAIVKKIIEDLGGKIWVDSEKNKGATFHFTWPKLEIQDIQKSEFVPI